MRLHKIHEPEERTPWTPRQRALMVGLPLLVALVIGLLQGRVVPLGDDWLFFSHFDFIALLPDSANPEAESAILTNTQADHGMRFRPFAYAHMWLERQVFGPRFAVNYWIGILYIGLAGSMLVLLLAQLQAPLSRAIVAGMLLVAHPAQSEVYGWASARVDTMAACFGIAALWLHVRGRFVLSCLAFAAAFLSKESAYPLVLLPILFSVFERRSKASCVLRAVPAVLALGATVALKVALVGSFFSPQWQQGVHSVPFFERVGGFLSYASPLLLQPTSSGADRTAAFLGAVFTALLLVSVLIPFALVVVRRESVDEVCDRAVRKLPASLLLAVGFVVTIAVTFGVPARSDFAGGRMWFLPSAFLIGFIACSCRPLPLWIALLPGMILLHQNLAPYREANRRMGIVLDRLAVEVNKPGRAVRAKELSEYYGPVPLFALMTNYYHERLRDPPGAITRVFLTRDDQRAKARVDLERDDRLWRAEMARQGRNILDLRWDAANAQLREVNPSPGK